MGPPLKPEVDSARGQYQFSERNGGHPIKIIIRAGLAALCLAGCGSITRRTTEVVAINSMPIGAKVTTDVGIDCTAPCVLKVPRNKDFTITAASTGYKTGTLFVGREVSGDGAAGMAGNVLVGGIVGIAIDAGTGAAMDHTPNPAFIELEADNAVAPIAPAPKGKTKRISDPKDELIS